MFDLSLKQAHRLVAPDTPVLRGRGSSVGILEVCMVQMENGRSESKQNQPRA